VNTAAVNRCKEENLLALQSIFLSLFPDVKERPLAAYRLVNQARRAVLGGEIDNRLVVSATKWVEKHREIYNKAIEDYEIRSSSQFLFLFGNKLVRTTFPSYIQCPAGVEWCRGVSNPDLTYTNDDSSVERVGSVSCYPAAFCKLAADKSIFRILIDAAPKSSNWLTFGVAKKGMANSSSDGVGRTTNTWGLSDDRSSSTNHTIIAASGTEVGSFRKLRVGDILSASIDTVEGWCEVSVNEDELVHRFTIPPGTAEDYYFAMTFANDHRVTILADNIGIKKTLPSKAGELNADHTLMYNHLKKHLRLILSELDETVYPSSSTSSSSVIAAAAIGSVPWSNLMTDGSKWLQKWNGDKEMALQQYEIMRPSIEALLNLKKDRGFKGSSFSASSLLNNSENEISQDDDPIGKLSWNTLLEAASWYRHNRDRIREIKRTEMGLNFNAIHDEDAPFMAAINLAEYHTHKVEREDTIASLAFMHMFPEEMNAWYDYNCSLKEPLIENIAKNCRCLPRHNRTCPLASKK
jgi:hypothetical protein